MRCPEASKLARGDRVTVREENIRPWTGVVTATKLGAAAWWAEVRRDDDGLTYGVVEDIAEKVCGEGPGCPFHGDGSTPGIVVEIPKNRSCSHEVDSDCPHYDLGPGEE